jgi:hypothetical protein
MRRIMALGACFGAALATAACNLITTDQRYVREGAGTDVYWSGLADATYLQELYIGYICQQAGLPVMMQGEALRCNDAALGPRDWGVFVQAGMNDIDKRCNAYLAWMDEKKRSSGPILQEVMDINAATSAIFLATGVGAIPMGIATAAFGLATNTLTNLDHRLILELEKTTVQAVVFTGRNTYRINLAKVTIDNRPAAIHALQSYLEICTPISIEANVNTTITVFERGGPGAFQALTNNRLNTTRTVAAAAMTARQAGGPPPRSTPPTISEYSEILDPYVPGVHSPSYVERLQKALCVPQTEYRRVGDATKILIKIFEDAEPGAVVNGKLDSREQATVLGLTANPCRPDGAQNFYERRTYADAAAVADLVQLLNKSPVGPQLPLNAALKDARTKIKAVRAALNGKLTLKLTGPFASQVTEELVSALFDLPNAPGTK